MVYILHEYFIYGEFKMNQHKAYIHVCTFWCSGVGRTGAYLCIDLSTVYIYDSLMQKPNEKTRVVIERNVQELIRKLSAESEREHGSDFGTVRTQPPSIHVQWLNGAWCTVSITDAQVFFKIKIIDKTNKYDLWLRITQEDGNDTLAVFCIDSSMRYDVGI